MPKGILADPPVKPICRRSRDVGCSEQLHAEQTTANPHYMKFTTQRCTQTQTHTIHTQRKSVCNWTKCATSSLGWKYPLVWLLAVSLSTFAGSQTELKPRPFFRQWPCSHSVPSQNYFSPWQLLHRNPSHGKCIREASFRTYSMYSFQEERVPPHPNIKPD